MFPQSSSWSTTKRILLSTLLVVSLLLPIYPQLLATMGCAHAQSAGQIRQASKDLIEKVNNGRGGDLVRVIIQPAGAWDSPLDSTVESSGGSNIHQFQNFRIRAVTISADAALALSTRKDVAYVSLNREVRTLGHVSLTTGADAVRTGEVSTGNGVDGTGIGIAVLDSGIDPEHRAFLDRSNNLRVMNSQGVGSTCWVLRALDWVASNRVAYNIRVVNMSLGMPAVDSYRNDPVCRAVRGLVNAGFVVVAAAGNNGVDSNGHKIYGHIHSPGNEPSALTVGASNTLGTDARNDDG